MGFRAGAKIANMEFIQFHPTILYDYNVRSFLISEAVRGEGAVLKVKCPDGSYREFMHKYHRMESLAPRDVVARAIDNEMKRTGQECVYLDIRHKSEEELKRRFPNIFAKCLEVGINMAKDLIPVVPAEHYVCGGVLTDVNGYTGIPGLYAAGECACTGLHGANRLASTSLLEAAVWGQSCGQHLARITASGREAIPRALAAAIPDWRPEGNEHPDDPALVAQDWANIRNTMWNYVGISRSKARLRRAFEDMRDLVRHIHDFYKGTRISKPLVDLFHGSQTAYVITQAAMRNKNSIGCHHRVD